MPNSRALDEGIIVQNTLTSTSTVNALSANMGRVLNESIQALDTRVDTLEAGTGSDTTFTPAADADIDALF